MLFLGEDGQLYVKDSAGTVTVLTGTGIPATILDAAGDLIIASAADTAARLARGTDGQALRSTGSTVAWEDDFYTLPFFIDGGGSVISTGRKLPVEAPMAGVIVAARAFLDQSGSISVDLWKDTYANYPPVDADSITASAPVAISSALKSEDVTLTGWTTSVAAGDIIFPNVDSVATATWAAIFLKVKKS